MSNFLLMLFKNLAIASIISSGNFPLNISSFDLNMEFQTKNALRIIDFELSEDILLEEILILNKENGFSIYVECSNEILLNDADYYFFVEDNKFKRMNNFYKDKGQRSRKYSMETEQYDIITIVKPWLGGHVKNFMIFEEKE